MVSTNAFCLRWHQWLLVSVIQCTSSFYFDAQFKCFQHIVVWFSVFSFYGQRHKPLLCVLTHFSSPWSVICCTGIPTTTPLHSCSSYTHPHTDTREHCLRSVVWVKHLLYHGILVYFWERPLASWIWLHTSVKTCGQVLHKSQVWLRVIESMAHCNFASQSGNFFHNQ